MKYRIFLYLVLGLIINCTSVYAVVWPLQTTNNILGRQCGSLTVSISANQQLTSNDGNYRITLYLFQGISIAESQLVNTVELPQYINYSQDLLNKTFNGLSNGGYFVDMKIENLTSSQTEYRKFLNNTWYSVGTGPSPGCTTWPTAGYAYNTESIMNNCVSFYGNFGYNQAAHNMCYNQGLVDVFYPKTVCIPIGNRQFCITVPVPVYTNVDVGKLLGYRFGNLPTSESSTFKYRSKLWIFCQWDYNTMTAYSPTITVTLPSGNGANENQDYSTTCKSTAEVVTMNALPTALGGTWSVVSPTGCGAYFDNPSDPKSKFYAGNCNNTTYTLRWTDNAGCYDDMTVTYSFKCGFQDYVDGNSEHYPTVSLGGKCWLAKNLNYGTYREMPTTYNEGGTTDVDKYCWMNNSKSGHTCTEYGGLYTQHHAERACKQYPNSACWHLSSDQDWQSLLKDNLSDNYSKLVYPTGFNHEEWAGELWTGFESGKPFGYGNQFNSSFWTSTQFTALTGYYWTYSLIFNPFVFIGIDKGYRPYKEYGYSVRCVRN